MMNLLHPAYEPESVLVAEDDDALREEIATELRSHGLKVIEVEDGLELEDYLAAARNPATHLSRPDVIVSEAVMPGMGGLTVLRHLREAHATTPFIVLAPGGDGEIFEEAEQLGAEYVMEKPFSVEDLRLAVFESDAPYGG